MCVQVLHVLDIHDTHLSMQQRENQLKKMESLWISRMMSEYPQGLNNMKQDPINRYKYYN